MVLWYLNGLDNCCIYGLTTAGSDKEEDNYVPRSNILDCTTSCINVAPMKDVLQQKKNLILLLSHALSPALPWTGNSTMIV